jgi:predicted nucleic acid-binding protein
MQYSIDTNAIIDLVRRLYPPKIFPTLLRNCELMIAAGDLIASDEVRHELERKSGDAVHAWAVAQPHLFVPTDEAIQRDAAEILGQHRGLVDEDATEPQADAFVIALARVRHCTVVSGEKRANNPNRPKIPNVCGALDIPCMNLLEFFEAQHWSF